MFALLRTVVLAAACLTASVVWAQAAQKDLQRGAYLMNGVVACGNCHMQFGPQGPMPDQGLSGGMVFDEPPFKAFVPNITPDNKTGIGQWTDAQLAKAIREGIRPDKRVIGPPMPIEFYRKISDQDLAAIVAYLRAQPAVSHAVARSEYRIPLPPNYGPPVQGIQTPKASDRLAYGKYLADIGHCMECHTPRDDKGMLVTSKFGAGGQAFKGPWGVSVSRNLTPHESGLKGVSDAAIERAIREGIDHKGQPMKPPMAFAFYKNINAQDMQALIAYLRSLKPVALGQ